MSISPGELVNVKFKNLLYTWPTIDRRFGQTIRTVIKKHEDVGLVVDKYKMSYNNGSSKPSIILAYHILINESIFFVRETDINGGSISVHPLKQQ
jgi:hypothetical protein